MDEEKKNEFNFENLETKAYKVEEIYLDISTSHSNSKEKINNPNINEELKKFRNDEKFIDIKEINNLEIKKSNELYYYYL